VNEDFAENIKSQQNLFYFGPGSDKCTELLKKYRNFIHVPGIRASAKFIGELAWIKFRNKQFENLIRFEPFYLKEFQATVPKNKLDDGRKRNDPQPG
jgi:tRNA threonylcarbamoyladenosine biosynthesis protein TsaB